MTAPRAIKGKGLIYRGTIADAQLGAVVTVDPELGLSTCDLHMSFAFSLAPTEKRWVGEEEEECRVIFFQAPDRAMSNGPSRVALIIQIISGDNSWDSLKGLEIDIALAEDDETVLGIARIDDPSMFMDLREHMGIWPSDPKSTCADAEAGSQ